jgi:hypothetical protein
MASSLKLQYIERSIIFLKKRRLTVICQIKYNFLYDLQLRDAVDDGSDGQPFHEQLQLILQHDGLSPLLHVSDYMLL